jgi:hypothetical protein
VAGKAEISSHGTAGGAGARLNKKTKLIHYIVNLIHPTKNIFELLQAQSIFTYTKRYCNKNYWK